jgi:hypothetical protein
MNIFALRSGVKVESDLFFCYQNAILAVGGKSHHLEIRNSCLFIDNEDTPIQIWEISNFLDLIVIDSNQMVSEDIPTLKILQSIQDAGVPIVVEIPDCYYFNGGLELIRFWQNLGFFIVIHNSRFKRIASHSKTLLIWPGFPISPTNYFLEWEKKTTPIGIFGSSHRQRNHFAKILLKNNLDSIVSLHTRKSLDQPFVQYQSYIDYLRNCEIVFTNGHVSGQESIIVGRALETMASGSVLIYEAGSDLDSYFTPYEHFVPVWNLYDFLEKVKFLQNNRSIGKDIGIRAHAHLSQHYGPEQFWGRIIKLIKN